MDSKNTKFESLIELVEFCQTIEQNEETIHQLTRQFQHFHPRANNTNKNFGDYYNVQEKFNQPTSAFVQSSPTHISSPQVMPQVVSQVMPQVVSQVKPQVMPQVMPQVVSQVKPQVLPQVASQVKPQVVSQVKPQVLPQVEPQVLTQVMPQVVAQSTHSKNISTSIQTPAQQKFVANSNKWVNKSSKFNSNNNKLHRVKVTFFFRNSNTMKIVTDA